MKRKKQSMGITRARQYDIYPILFAVYIIPLILWGIIVYHFWWHEKTSRWKFGKFIVIPLLFPFLYAFVNLWIDLANAIPFPPDFKMCFRSFAEGGARKHTHMTPKLEKHLMGLGILGMWNMRCETTVLPEIATFMMDLNTRADTVAGGLLLVGLVATAFKKRVFLR